LVVISTAADLHRHARQHLASQVEAAGFFLADYRAEARQFRLRQWRPVPASGFESRSDHHLVLADDFRAEIIKWAWDSGSSLVEAHSHDFGIARFSPSDMSGLREWLPHLWWRLRGRPYGAVVVDGDTFDALAWVASADPPEHVVGIELDGGGFLPATGLTLGAKPAPQRGQA
jgi:hypothetical protein